MIGLNGGLLGAQRSTNTSTAPGVWAGNEQVLLRRANNWPRTDDPYAANVSLLLHMDGSNGSTTFVDSSSSAKTVTANGDVKISTAQSKFGGSSALFDGTGDYLTSPWSNTFEFDSGDFTIEFWAYIIGGNALLCWSTDYHYGITYNYGGATGSRVGVWVSSNGSSWNVFNADGGGNGISTGTITASTWTHVALCRSGQSFALYLNGASAWTGSSSAAIINRSTDTFRIGGPWPAAGPAALNGYIDDLRITKGVARYTANFTPPTAAFLDP